MLVSNMIRVEQRLLRTNNMYKAIIFLIAIIFIEVDSARVLGIFHIPAYSHQQLGNKLLYELAARGHEVTLITSSVPKTTTKNVRIVPIVYPDRKEEEKPNMFDFAGKGIISKVLFHETIGLTISELVLNQTSVQNLLKSNEKFDVVIMEQFLNEAFRGFCHHYRAPCVLLSTIGPSRWTNLQMGNPANPSYVSEMLYKFSSRMSFFERLRNSLLNVAGILFSYSYIFPKHNELMHKHFPNAPHLYDLYFNTSLMLLNSHVSTNAPVPLLPNMIEIGGYHVSPPKRLPKDLQEYLDDAKDGAIFFSMGSNLMSKNIDIDKRDAILDVFRNLKQKVLWKWENETFPDRPGNVKLGKWLPQQDILAHPNIRAFVTHGGLLSTIESIYHGVPILGIPIYGDQEMNMANSEMSGYALTVHYADLNEKNFGEALDRILNDPTYTENAKKRSKIMHDQPIKPLDKAIFWVEYVLRHNGAPHLKTSALDLSWYQYLLLDVLLFAIVIKLILCYSIYKIYKTLFRTKKLKVN